MAFFQSMMKVKMVKPVVIRHNKAVKRRAKKLSLDTLISISVQGHYIRDSLICL